MSHVSVGGNITLYGRGSGWFKSIKTTVELYATYLPGKIYHLEKMVSNSDH
jgi:hypothetical protein